MSQLLTASTAGLIAAAVLLVALLINRFAPDKRQHIRRTIVLLGLFAIAWGAARGLAASDAWWAKLARASAEVLGVFTLVASGGVAVFDLLLRAVRIRVPTIAAELSMGAAYLVAGLWVMRRFGFDPAGLLATSAVLTGILALSLQATLGNVIGGVALQLDNSIRVGDWVQLENGRQGLVREIRWRHTVIETRDCDTLIVPNALLLGSTFTILGKRQGEPVRHRMWVYFNVDFRFSPAEVIDVVESALRSAPIESVAADPPANCVCFDFARERRDSMAYYAVRYWLTDLAQDDPASSRVRIRIFAALKRAEIPLAVPAAHLWVEQDSTERRQRKLEREMTRRRQALESVSFLAPLSSDEHERLIDRLHYAPFAAGETITREGAVAHFLYIITEGEAEVVVGQGKNAHHVATIVGPDVVGEMGLMTGEPRSASVVANTNVECYRLDKDAFKEVLAGRPALAAEISDLIAARRINLSSELELTSASSQRLVDEKVRVLSAVRRFFGLSEE